MIKEIMTKTAIIILLMAGLLFALEEVPRDENRSTDESRNKQETPSKTTGAQDRFQDSDSNSVNDQREDDFQIIKSFNSKFKLPLNPLNHEEPPKKKEEKKPSSLPAKKSPEKTKPNSK